MVRWFVVLPAAAIFLAIDAGAHYYIATRMVLDTALEGAARSIGIGVVLVGAILFFAHPIAERTLAPRYSRYLAWPATIWMGAFFWLVLALMGSDLLLWLAAAVGGPLPDLASARSALVGTLVGVASAAGLREGLRGPRDVRVEIELARWPRALDGYRIAQISDIHIGPTLDRRFARQLTQRVNALDADLVAVTGDLVDGPIRHLGDEVQPFGELHGRDGVFFVTGNHDFYSGVEPWADLARSLGMRVLRNERETVRASRFAAHGAEASFQLAGVDDHRQRSMPGDGGEDLETALEGLTAAQPVVLLAHDPSTFKRAHAMGVDLQISGHTHGGQIWPFEYFVRAVIPFVAGRYRRGEAELYVSRGSGYWGPPMRLFAPAEITELVLRAPRKATSPA